MKCLGGVLREDERASLGRLDQNGEHLCLELEDIGALAYKIVSVCEQ
jgi:hypothetical protein